MQVGDLITHNPTGAVGTIVAVWGTKVRVHWCTHGDDPDVTVDEIIEMMFMVFCCNCLCPSISTQIMCCI